MLTMAATPSAVPRVSSPRRGMTRLARVAPPDSVHPARSTPPDPSTVGAGSFNLALGWITARRAVVTRTRRETTRQARRDGAHTRCPRTRPPRASRVGPGGPPGRFSAAFEFVLTAPPQLKYFLTYGEEWRGRNSFGFQPIRNACFVDVAQDSDLGDSLQSLPRRRDVAELPANGKGR